MTTRIVVDANTVDRIIRPAEACRILGIGRSTLYRQVSAGRLPPPIKITPGASGWPESVIRDYIAERAAA